MYNLTVTIVNTMFSFEKKANAISGNTQYIFMVNLFRFCLKLSDAPGK